MKPVLDYPLFLGPGKFFARPVSTWSKNEAREYFEWIMKAKKARLEHLVRVVGGADRSKPIALLRRLGSLLQKLIGGDYFAEDSIEGRRPNGQGSALAADAGLLVGDLLVDRHKPAISWSLDTKDRRLADFNQVVVIGWPFSPPENFIRFGIGQAYFLARGTGNTDALAIRYHALDYEATNKVKVFYKDVFGPPPSALTLRELEKRGIEFTLVSWSDKAKSTDS